MTPDGPPYGAGAASGAIARPAGAAATGASQRATLAWQGGPQGLDRPVDRAFVTAERRARGRWVHADDDLGLAMLWKVDDDGPPRRVQWEIPRDAPRGTYRFVVTAKRYRLESRSFEVSRHRRAERRARARAAAAAWRSRSSTRAPIRDVDLTYRPQYARGGVVRFRVGNRNVRGDGASAGRSSR